MQKSGGRDGTRLTTGLNQRGNPTRPGMPKAAIAVLVGLIQLGVLFGCTVGPDFQRPEAVVPVRWSDSAPAAAGAPKTASDETLARWWTVFGDPVLTSLVDRAAAGSLDLKLAEARIREARAARAVAAGGLGPALDASGSYRRSRSSVAGAQEKTATVTADQYQAGFDAAWEIDLFGGRRRSLEATEADLEAAVESRRDTMVRLMAEVARNYIQLRAYQQQIAITGQNLAAQQHSARLTRARFEGGFVSGLDVANADAQVAETAAQVPVLELSARQTLYNIGILIGEAPAALDAELSPAGAIAQAPPEVPAGIPSDLLRRRPDIRQAEARIHAATARIGVAVAELFPRFTVSGAAGYRSDDFSSLLEGSSRFWSLGPSAVWRLFESGGLRAGVEVQKALQEQEVIAYQQTVLAALQEVENALVASVKEQAHRDALAAAVAANRKAVSLAEKLYVEGMTDFINVLQAQQSLYSTENALAQSTAAVSLNLVAVYKALGGGWSEESLEPPPSRSKSAAAE